MRIQLPFFLHKIHQKCEAVPFQILATFQERPLIVKLDRVQFACCRLLVGRNHRHN